MPSVCLSGKIADCKENQAMLYFGHIAGILKDPKNEWALIEEEHYSAKTIFLTQISILAAIPAVALYIGVTQVGW